MSRTDTCCLVVVYYVTSAFYAENFGFLHCLIMTCIAKVSFLFVQPLCFSSSRLQLFLFYFVLVF